MLIPHAIRCLALLLAVSLLAGCGGSAADEGGQPLPRPVAVFPLQSIDPSTKLAVTGSLAAWKVEEIGFQVGGRIENIYFEAGENLYGRTFDEEGTMLTPGDTIAELESRRYQLAKDSAEANLQSALARVKALHTEIEYIIPKRVAAAGARQKLASQEFARIETLYRAPGGTVTKSQLDKAQADLDTADADLREQIESRNVKLAELKAIESQALEAAEAVEQAKKDLEDTRLTAPYHGQIAEMQVIEGGVVQAGQPVVRVQMMDPLKIEVSVSPETDRRVGLGDLLDVYIDENSPPMEGYVWLKDTVADPATRTFRLQLLVRNQLIESGLPASDEKKDYYRAGSVGQLFTESAERKAPYYVVAGARRRSLYEDSQGPFVWRLAESSDPVQGAEGETARKMKLEKVRVKVGEARLPFLQVATFRELTDVGTLDPENDFIVGDILRPDGTRLVQSGLEAPDSLPTDETFEDGGREAPPAEPVAGGETSAARGDRDEEPLPPPLDAEALRRLQDEQAAAKQRELERRRQQARAAERKVWDEIGDTLEVVQVRRRWMMRPGDYVRVDLRGQNLPKGFYVPMDAVVESNGKFHVVVAEKADGGTKAKHVPVEVSPGALLDTMRHVEPVEEGGLSVGTPIVASGAYYVVDGEPLAVAREVTLQP